MYRTVNVLTDSAQEEVCYTVNTKKHWVKIYPVGVNITPTQHWVNFTQDPLVKRLF